MTTTCQQQPSISTNDQAARCRSACPAVGASAASRLKSALGRILRLWTMSGVSCCA